MRYEGDVTQEGARANLEMFRKPGQSPDSKELAPKKPCRLYPGTIPWAGRKASE